MQSKETKIINYKEFEAQNNGIIDNLEENILSKFSNILSTDNSEKQSEFYNQIKDYLQVEIIEDENKTIYRFTLNQQGQNIFNNIQDSEILKKLLNKKLEEKPNFDSINNAIIRHNESVKDESKKIKLITELLDLENEEIKKLFGKEVKKIEKKENKKTEIKELFKYNTEINDIEGNLNQFDLQKEFKIEKSSYKTTFLYEEIIKKPKEIKHNIGEENEEIKSFDVIELINKHKGKAIGVLLVLAFYLYDGKNNEVKESYNPQNPIDPMSMLSKTEREEIVLKNIENEIINITTIRIHTIVKEIGVLLKKSKKTLLLKNENIGELEIKLLKFKINEMNNDLKINNKSDYSLFIKNNFHISGNKIIGIINIIMNNEIIHNMELNIPIKK